MKKILIGLSVLLFVGYIIFVVTKFAVKPAEEKCQKIQINVMDSASIKFMSSHDIYSFLIKNDLYPEGKKIKDINTEVIEQKLKSVPIIATAECFFTPSGNMHVNVTQRKPIMRIMGSSGNYYIDEAAKIIPVSSNFNVFLPIATGKIDTLYAQTSLHDLALFLKKDDFWNAQIAQIDVQENKDVILIPRVGDHQIILGKIDNFEPKLTQLMEFYQKGLNETGWNKYKQINLKFDGQIVCTKR